MAADKPWQDRETLRELYVEKRMSSIKIAEHFDDDITDAGIRYWIDKHGIEKRSRSEAAQTRWHKRPLRPYTDSTNGYERIEDKYDGGDDRVSVHRLLAVAKFGIDAMKDKVVHHRNNIPWDNRPDNLELMTISEHVEHHHREDTLGGRHN